MPLIATLQRETSTLAAVVSGSSLPDLPGHSWQFRQYWNFGTTGWTIMMRTQRLGMRVLFVVIMCSAHFLPSHNRQWLTVSSGHALISVHRFIEGILRQNVPDSPWTLFFWISFRPLKTEWTMQMWFPSVGHALALCSIAPAVPLMHHYLLPVYATDWPSSKTSRNFEQSLRNSFKRLSGIFKPGIVGEFQHPLIQRVYTRHKDVSTF
jgi:hypothetical protein